jgi:hypothetical protein
LHFGGLSVKFVEVRRAKAEVKRDKAKVRS